MSEAQTLLNGGTGAQGESGAGAADPVAGGGADPGLSWLPEEFRADAAFKDLKDVSALAKVYKDTKSFVGADKADLLRLPKDPAAAEWNDVHKALGRPDKPEEYKLATPDWVKPEVITEFGTTAHALGLSTKQASEVLGFYSKTVTAQAAAIEAAAVAETSQTEAALKTEWGNAYPDKVHAITRLLANAGGDDALKAFNDAGGGRNPVLLRALAKIADGMAEPSALRGGGGGGMGSALTPADAKAAIGRKQLDAEFMKAYNTRDHAGHTEALAEMNKLYQQAYPS